VVHHFETLKFYKNKVYTLIFLTPLKFSHPLYLPNGEQLGKNKHTMIIRTLKNGGGGGKSVQNPEIKTQICWEHPNPKPYSWQSNLCIRIYIHN
jgi:hypothetical protein